MLNEQINETSAHAIITQIASYYDAVDNSVKTGDTYKRYSVTTNSCTSPSAPIANKSFTNLVISPTADNHADLYNSFVYAKLSLKSKTLLLMMRQQSQQEGLPHHVLTIPLYG